MIAGKYETCRHRNIFNQKYFHTTKNRWKSLKLVQRKKFKDSFLSITIGYRKLKGWESCYSSFINATRDVRGANSSGFDWLPQRGSSLQLLMHLSQASHTFANHHSMSICVSLAPWSSDFVMISPWYFRILNAGSWPRPGSDSPLLKTGTTQLFQIWRCLEQGKLRLYSFNAANAMLLSLLGWHGWNTMFSESVVTWPQTVLWDYMRSSFKQ